MPQGRRSSNRQAFYEAISPEPDQPSLSVLSGSPLLVMSSAEYLSLTGKTHHSACMRLSSREQAYEPGVALDMQQQRHKNQMASILAEETDSPMHSIVPQQHLSIRQMLTELTQGLMTHTTAQPDV